jgi:hypothetical protein
MYQRTGSTHSFGFLKGRHAINGETKLIQEGTDNVDINTKTIDGKDTFHSMARTVFQVQSSSDRPTIDPIKRSSDHSLHTTEASYLMVSNTSAIIC